VQNALVVHNCNPKLLQPPNASHYVTRKLQLFCEINSAGKFPPETFQHYFVSKGGKFAGSSAKPNPLATLYVNAKFFAVFSLKDAKCGSGIDLCLNTNHTLSNLELNWDRDVTTRRTVPM